MGCCADIRDVRRQTACAINYDMEVASVTCGSEAFPGEVAATPVGVSPGHWGASPFGGGSVGASSVRAAAGLGLAGADGAAPGVARAVMARPGGAVVKSQGSGTGTGL